MADTTKPVQDSGKPIRIAVILGSVRPGNFTGKAAALVIDELRKDEEVDVDVIDPSSFTLLPPGQADAVISRGLQQRIRQATGVVIATPEYHGTFSSVVKLVIEHLGFPSALRSKPVALLGVAAGSVGAIKSLEHLRSVVSHIGALVLPGPVSVANVQRLFDEKGTILDTPTEKMVRGVAHSLLDYMRGHICPRLSLEQMTRNLDAQAEEE